MDAEEFPLFEAVAREQLLKTYQAGRRLGGRCGYLELWKLSIAL
jgi:hypothetical protein